MRVEKGEERNRAAVLENSMTIAVADFGCFSQGELVGVGEKWHRSGTYFVGNVVTDGPEDALALLSGRVHVSDVRPKNKTQNPVGLRVWSVRRFFRFR